MESEMPNLCLRRLDVSELAGIASAQTVLIVKTRHNSQHEVVRTHFHRRFCPQKDEPSFLMLLPAFDGANTLH